MKGLLIKFRENWKARKKLEKVWFVFKGIIILIVLGLLICGIFADKLFAEGSLLGEAFKIGIGDTINITNFFKDKLPSILKSIVYIVIAYIFINITKVIVKVLFSANKRSKTFSNLINSFIKYTTAIVLICLLLSIWGVDTTTLLASVGILGLVIGLGAQSLIEDIISGLFIIFEGEYQIDDIIVIDGFRGTVLEIGIRTTKIIDAGGDIKTVNNSSIRNVINMTHALSLAINDFTINYNESLERVEVIIKENLERMRQQIPTIKEGPYYRGVHMMNESGVVLRMIAKCKEEDRFQTIRDINRQIRLVLAENNVSVAVPQIVVNPPVKEMVSNVKEKNKAKSFIDQQKEASKHITEDNNQK